MHIRQRVGAMLAAAAVAAVAGLITVPATPAHAGVTAMERCRSGAQPNSAQTVTHPGWQVGSSFPTGANPPNAILPGDVVRVTVIGAITYDRWLPPRSAGPAGDGIPAGPDWPFPGMTQYALIANWNNNPTGWVGGPMLATSMTCVAAPAVPTRLIYYINDNYLSDNGGAFTVRTDLFFGP
jgi:hypothetical protein